MRSSLSDDGPTAQTGRLLTVLRDHDATATFFNVGANVQHYPDAAPAEIAVGQVANHSYSHPYLARLPYTAVFRELLGTNQIIASTVGTTPVLFRPPFDRTNANTTQGTRILGMTQVLWTIDTRDYRGPTDTSRAASPGPGPGTSSCSTTDRPETVPNTPRRLAHQEARRCHVQREGGRPVTAKK
jgi:peptidoglycan/xylan/chitin deacetylase (PgdA/CDA1 family)